MFQLTPTFAQSDAFAPNKIRNNSNTLLKMSSRARLFKIFGIQIKSFIVDLGLFKQMVNRLMHF